MDFADMKLNTFVMLSFCLSQYNLKWTIICTRQFWALKIKSILSNIQLEGS